MSCEGARLKVKCTTSGTYIIYSHTARMNCSCHDGSLTTDRETVVNSKDEGALRTPVGNVCEGLHGLYQPIHTNALRVTSLKTMKMEISLMQIVTEMREV